MQPSDGETVMQNENDEEKEIKIEEEEEKIQINRYNVVFHSIMEKNGEYSVLADLLDESMNELENRKLLINEETDIRENGKRLSPEGLVYAVESMAGDKIIFDAQIRENDNVIISISFEGDFEEETNNPDEEEEIVENENKNEEIPTSEELPKEETTVPEKVVEESGVVVE